MHWHVPSSEELEAASRLLKKFVVPEMDKLKQCMNGKTFTRCVTLTHVWKDIHIFFYLPQDGLLQVSL